jgi:phage terminase small subunit
MKLKFKTPAGLSGAARTLWVEVQRGYSVRDPAGLAVLEQTLRAFDRAESARRVVDRKGCTSTDRYGQERVNPAANVERDARAQFFAGLKLLRVDVPVGGDEREED